MNFSEEMAIVAVKKYFGKQKNRYPYKLETQIYKYNTNNINSPSEFIVNYVLQFFFIVLYLFYHFILYSMNSSWTRSTLF